MEFESQEKLNSDLTDSKSCPSDATQNNNSGAAGYNSSDSDDDELVPLKTKKSKQLVLYESDEESKENSPIPSPISNHQNHSSQFLCVFIELILSLFNFSIVLLKEMLWTVMKKSRISQQLIHPQKKPRNRWDWISFFKHSLFIDCFGFI